MSNPIIPRVHQVDSDGNLEWVERVITNQRRAPLFIRGKFHLTEQQFREALRLAYRNGASEHQMVLRDVVHQVARLVPDEKP